MKIPAPLNHPLNHSLNQTGNSDVRTRSHGVVRHLLCAAIGLGLCGCATQVEIPAATQTSKSLASVGLSTGAAAISADATTTPSIRAAGMTADRKRALRNLAVRSVRTDNPGQYTVVRGDTLWDISERFLSRPWLWPEIWQVNPQIENPHLIYPGDQVSLTYVDGQPQLQLIRAASRTGTPIGGFPAGEIKSFLVDTKIVSANDLRTAPYVVGTEDGRLIASEGNHIYARGNLSDGRYTIFRPGKALIDPDTREVLGHEAIQVSRASMIKTGDPSKLVITSNKRETLVGDRLMQNGAETTNFAARPAAAGNSGKIISLFDAVGRVGKNQVVVVNLGANDGVQPGDVFNVYGDDRKIRDVVSGKKQDWITIEGEQAGTVMVFRSFAKASYALVVSSAKTINLYDRIGDIK